ncbi:MAG: type II toxin-antitoxin system YhaV family toxin [Cyanobacteria bacterium P01_A01_bin.83]
MSDKQPLILNGWRVFAHPLFTSQLEELSNKVELLRQKYPQDYQKKNTTKRLAAINRLAFEIIPQDPTRKEYRQGNTLGSEYKHWFRAKFFQQYRLFFRYHQQQKIIVYAWVNDAKSKRIDESKTDAYIVFKRMLKSGNPPDNWEMLLKQAQSLNE